MRDESRRAKTILAIALVIASTGGAAGQPGALSRATVQEAIAFGLSGDPRPYLLRHARDRNGGTNDVVVAALYTPFLRVAIAARSAREEGRVLDPNNLPGWLVAPDLLVAVRWYLGEPCEFEPAMAEPLVTAVPRGASTGPLHSASGWHPLQVYPGSALLRAQGVPQPFTDVAVVVTYPVELMRKDVDLLVSKQGLRDGREGACVLRARIPSTELTSWR
jgi:hypothetical protein